MFRRAAAHAAGAELRAWLATHSAVRRAALIEGRPVTDAERDAGRYPGYSDDLRMLRGVGMDQSRDYMAPDDNDRGRTAGRNEGASAGSGARTRRPSGAISSRPNYASPSTSRGRFPRCGNS